jgi:hypothetical protein
MSLAFLLFCLWLIPALASPGFPARQRAVSRLVLCGLGGLIALLALLSGGVLPFAFATLGVWAVIPEPMRAIAAMVRERLQAARAARTA